MANWGGARPGAGRPKGSKNVGIEQPRKQRLLRVHDDEWELIKRFDKLVKERNKEDCIKFLNEMKNESVI